MKYIALITTIFLFSACEAPNPYSDGKIEMRTTPCFGDCPVFSIIIHGDGTAYFKGFAETEREGDYKLTLNKEQTSMLFQAFEQADFWGFEDEYTSNVSDLSTTYLTLTIGDKRKKVTDYYGAPKALKELEKRIHKVVKMDSWTAM